MPSVPISTQKLHFLHEIVIIFSCFASATYVSTMFHLHKKLFQYIPMYLYVFNFFIKVISWEHICKFLFRIHKYPTYHFFYTNHSNETITIREMFCIHIILMAKPKYSKHWLYTVAHTIECVCSKINNSWFNPWFSFYFTSSCSAPFIEWHMC